MAIIRFFAAVREKMGMDSMTIRLDNPAPLRLVLEAAARTASADPSILTGGGMMYAVNHEMAGLDHMVADSDEVAALPPLSGGV